MTKRLFSFFAFMGLYFSITAQLGFVGNMFPDTDNSIIPAGASFSVYVQVYKAGVTDSGGQGGGISCQLRVRTTSTTTDPNFSNATIATSYEMTYNSDIGNNDEYTYTIPSVARGRYSYECACSDDNFATEISTWNYNTLSGELEYITSGTYDTYRTMLVVNNTFYDINKFQPGNTDLPASIGGTYGDRFCNDESLILGGETNIFKVLGSNNVSASKVYYNIDGNSYTSFDLNSPVDNCPGPGANVMSFSSGGSCFNTGTGSSDVLDQRWQNQTGSSNLLTGLSAGNHTVNFYFETTTSMSGMPQYGSGSFTFFKVNQPTGPGCQAALLPVLLDQFSAKKEKETVRLQWQTLSELNNDYFLLERSKDAKNWQALGNIKGEGTTNEKVNYVFVDENPWKGINFYRLIQFDFDGTKTIHEEIISVQMGHAEVVLYPNPAQHEISLLMGDLEVKYFAVYDWTGQEVKVHKTGQTLDISTLSDGAYLIKIDTGDDVVVQRFIKQ